MKRFLDSSTSQPEAFTCQPDSPPRREQPPWTSQLVKLPAAHSAPSRWLLRLQAGRAAGDLDVVGTVSAAIRTLLAQVRRYQERTTDVLLDAYQRDLGGD